MLLLKVACILLLVSIAASKETVTTTASTRITSYDPGELLAKIFNPNTTISSRQRGLVFEDQITPQINPDEDHGQYGLITFEDGNQKLKFEDSQDVSNRPLRFDDDGFQGDGNDIPLQDESQGLVGDPVTFQDDNTIDQGNKRKRRRRRRKPKKALQNHGIKDYYGGSNLQGVPGRPGYGLNPYPGFEPNLNANPGFGPNSNANPGFGTNPYVNPGFGTNPTANPGFPGPVPFRRRRRRPRPSLASDALTAVTGALTSIALYDDYQCVPRLLCEAAGGGSLGSNGVLNSIAGIQPLLTLLSAYHGISTSPLFVFGRAVFLGMTSRGNTGTCRYAYPQCPTDPEELIHYLNNHNGGFFRFFNNPLPNQNLEQFYDYLGQNGQFDGQNGQFNGQHLGQNGQFNLGQDFNQQHYQQGSYGLYNQQPTQDYGFQNNHIGNQRPSMSGHNYGSNYDYNTYGSKIRFKNSSAKLEKRIQNKPVNDVDDRFEDDNNLIDTKWQFLDDSNSNSFNTGPTDSNAFDGSDINGNPLKFPEESQNYDDTNDYKRKGKSILFPENKYDQNAYSNKNYVNMDNQNNYNRVRVRPNYQNNYNKVTTARPYYQYNYNHQNSNDGYRHATATPFNENDYYYDHRHNFYVKKDKKPANYNNNYNYVKEDQAPVNYNNNYNKYQAQNNVYYNREQNTSSNNYNKYDESRFTDDGSQTVYVVRGNGDPNNPEIVKVRPGQTIH